MEMSEQTANKFSQPTVSTVGANSPPLVSVVVPAFNAEKTLHSCLEALLSQEFPKEQYEVIVVDNDSNDGTWAIIRSYGSAVRGLRETNVRSSYAARNAGVRASRGRVIAFTDADCVPNVGWLRLLVANFDDPAFGCVAGEVLPFNPVTRIEKFAAQAGILRQKRTLKNRNRPYAQTANVAYRRKVFEQIGLFNSSLDSGGDADFCWRMQKQTRWKLCFDDAAIVLHRHRSSLRELWKQFVRYGQGNAALQLLYADYEQPSLGSVFGCIRKLLTLGRYAGHYLVCTLLMRKAQRITRETLDFAFYSFICHLAYIFGRLRGSRAKVSKDAGMNDVVQNVSCG
jgi:cellulose synthase/poly-beta-1,6-N-acetylglucosamine synthase-like glycosyltransferase